MANIQTSRQSLPANPPARPKSKYHQNSAAAEDFQQHLDGVDDRLNPSESKGIKHLDRTQVEIMDTISKPLEKEQKMTEIEPDIPEQTLGSRCMELLVQDKYLSDLLPALLCANEPHPDVFESKLADLLSQMAVELVAETASKRQDAICRAIVTGSRDIAVDVRTLCSAALSTKVK